MATGVDIPLGNLGEQALSFHTADGRIIGEVPAEAVRSVSWNRERREVSRCQVEVSTQAAADVLEDVVPWLHWMSVWDHDIAVWTGPVQINDMKSSSTMLQVRDPSTFLWRTRVPVSRTWAALDPTKIAADLWALMAEVHNIPRTPLVMPSLSEEAFTIQAVADSRMLHALMDDLVKAGLQWTVVGGRALFGDFPQTAQAVLTDTDFNVEIGRRRDGTGTFNNVKVMGRNWSETGRAELGGLNLQGLVSLDDMGGVSNIQKATRRHVQEKATIRDALYLPANASLAPDAPLTLGDLVPGRVFAIHSLGVSQLVVLDAMNCESTPENFDIQVTLEAVQNPTEIERLSGGAEAAL